MRDFCEKQAFFHHFHGMLLKHLPIELRCGLSMVKSVIVGILLALSGCTSPVARISQTLLTEARSPNVLVFKDVNILTVTDTGVVAGQTIVIQGDTIAAIGNTADMVIPVNAAVIEARGKYIMPGLVDMHVHITDEEDVLLLLAHGVTTVRNMADMPGWTKTFMGFADVLPLRDDIRGAKIVGPDIYSTGEALDGSPPVSPFNAEMRTDEDIDAEIRRQKAAGYDALKIYDMLTLPHFRRILQLAVENEMPVVGHVPFQVSLREALASDIASIEHLTGYINNNEADFIISRDSLREYARLTKTSRHYNCPTLVIWDRLPEEDGYDTLRTYPQFEFVSRKLRWLWRQTLSNVYDIDSSKRAGYARHMMAISKQMTKALYDEGCPLLVGTDMNFVGVFPGVSTLREMELLAEAGVSAQDVLRAATLHAAACLGRADRFGSVELGKRADLVMLDRNPLEDMHNIRSTSGVLVRGLWLDRSRIDWMLDQLK